MAGAWRRGEWRKAKLWLTLPHSVILPLQVTAADAESICHELIPLSPRHSSKRNGSTFPAD